MAYEAELKQAVELIKAGDKKAGGKIVHDILLKDRNNERAWLWMAVCTEKLDDRQFCLKEVLRLNPENESAKKALAKMEEIEPALEDLLPEKPAPITPAPENTIASQPILAQPIQIQSGSNSISTIIIILLIIMALFWLVVAFAQLGLGAAGVNTAQSDNSTMVMCGIWNILISVINLALIGDVLKRYRRVVQNLTFLGVVGSIWGVFQLFSGAWLQACAVPLYIVLAVLAQTNKAYFSELTEKEKQENQRAQAALQK